MLVLVRPSVCRRKSGAVTVAVRPSVCCSMSGDMFVDVRAKPFPADGDSGLVRSQFLPGVLGSADSRLPFVGRTSCGGPSLVLPPPSVVHAEDLLLVCLAGPGHRISHHNYWCQAGTSLLALTQHHVNTELSVQGCCGDCSQEAA